MQDLSVLKSFNSSDLKYLRGPILSLLAFILVAFLIFPKPSKIYRDGIHKECSCLGVKASPRVTKGIGVGDTYCIGIPVKCQKTQILRDANE